MAVVVDQAKLDARVAELAERYLPLAVAILKETIRIPADYVDKPEDQGGDPMCGLSNHEKPRLEFLKQSIIDIKAVASPDDVKIDALGNLYWTVQDGFDSILPEQKKVIYLDGHSDTVQPLRGQWREKLAGAIDCYDGVLDSSKVTREMLTAQLGYVPAIDEIDNLVFGRGSADQLAGVVSQVIATKILLELAPEGALQGSIIHSYASIVEEDNDGETPRYIVQDVLPGAAPDVIPDVVILTEGTGDNRKGALGIYRGQRGRMQIEVSVTGRSCHGSMPHLGLNPLEHAGAIVAEAASPEAQSVFKDHAFLGRGTRTASWSVIQTPSDCAVPDKFTFRFDRRLTVGEDDKSAIAEVEALKSVQAARDAGLTVDISVPRYTMPTFTGYVADNAQYYPGWETPEDHPAIQAIVDSYKRVITPFVTEPEGGAKEAQLRAEPRVDCWVFSTDGVGFPIPADSATITVPESKRWLQSGPNIHPPMFGIGAGVEQNTHRIGEFVDARELKLAISAIARFPSLFAEL